MFSPVDSAKGLGVYSALQGNEMAHTHTPTVVTTPVTELNDAAIEQRIYLIRGHKVMLDVNLAGLYDVPTKRLNEQVRRNLSRFPDDFFCSN